MANGIIIIDKPAGWTSMDVCAKLRGALRERRIGHAGTLDPMATGVLPVFVGRATRAVEFAAEGEKEYVAGLRLGVITNTQDSTGTVLETRPVHVDRTALERVLEGFRGELLQVPPMYSAVKIGGRKLYELARKGQEVERKARRVTIHALEVLEPERVRAEAPEMDPLEPDTWFLRVRCSKGTYVRTLCHEIGQALGCGGCMSALRRTMACGFPAAEAIPLEAVLRSKEPQALLLPVDRYFVRCGWEERVTVSPAAERRLRNGGAAAFSGAEGNVRVYSQSGEFLLLARCAGGQMTPIKSFFEVEQ